MAAAIQLAGTAGAASHQRHGGQHDCWWASSCSAPTHLDGVAFALLALGPLALVLRRTYPRGVLLAVFAVTLAYVALGYLQGPSYAALAVAIVTAVMAGHRNAAAAALIAAWTLFLWLPAALGSTGAPTLLALLAIAAWLALLLAGSEALRGKRERVAVARRAAEQEARRRADEERLRIARELHDVLAHNISLINVQSGVALHLIDEQPQQARIALSAINEASADALREVRSVLSVLRRTGEQPPRAPTPGLDRLDELLSHAEAAGVEISLQVRGDERGLPASVDLAAFRIVQEAVTNIVRHAGAGAATVQLIYDPADLILQIDDDGSGGGVAGDGDRLPAGGGGVARDGDSLPVGGNGIAGMRERAVALGGELDAGPRSAGGFRVRARLPIPGGG